MEISDETYAKFDAMDDLEIFDYCVVSRCPYPMYIGWGASTEVELWICIYLEAKKNKKGE